MESNRRGRSAKNPPATVSVASVPFPQNSPMIDSGNKTGNGTKDAAPVKEPSRRGRPPKTVPGAHIDAPTTVPNQTPSNGVSHPVKKLKTDSSSVSATVSTATQSKGPMLSNGHSNPLPKGRGRPKKVIGVSDAVASAKSHLSPVAVAQVDSDDDAPPISIGNGKVKINGNKRNVKGTKKIDDKISSDSDSDSSSKTGGNPTKKSKTTKNNVVVDEEPEPNATIKKQIVKKGKAPVDEFYGNAESVHVFSEEDDVWDVALNQTAIDNNNNKFYLIQLLEHDQRKQYFVFIRWGRVGVKGQQSIRDFGANLEEAKNFFCAKFNDKTKNVWSDRQDFEKYPGKYDMVLRDYEATDVPDALVKPAVSAEPVKIPESKLPVSVQTLIQTIFNIRMMEEQVMEMNYDAKKAPLGKLTDRQIKLGYASLKRIASVLNLTPVPGVPVSKIPSQKDLTDACNEYYTRIPHDFAMKRPPLINTPQALKREMDLLETLGDIEVAMRALKDNLSLDENPVDHSYRTLGVDIQPVERNGPTFKLVEQYLLLTHGPTHVHEYTLELMDVFATKKETPFQDVGNRMLLWHGSRLSNFAGILSQGLRIAPPEAPVTGYMFGKGIYFADVSTKSANYCFSQTSHDVGMMLLCEVALGKPNELYDAKYDADQLPQGCFSTKGVGSHVPDDATYQTTEDGVKIPVGKCVDVSGKQRGGQRGALLYNEYIVYDVKQVRMRYLVQVKFNRKRSLR